jgi:hypothetical protein
MSDDVMNPHVKELAHESGLYVPYFGSNYPEHIRINLFAEKLVNKLCEKISELESRDPTDYTIHEVKKYFGVKP